MATETKPVDNTPKCPQCGHAVKLNAATCAGCGKLYHELCLKRGCNCGGKAPGAGAGGGGGGRIDRAMAAGFALGLAGLGAAVWTRGPRATSAEMFYPAAITGAIGLAAALTRKLDDDDAKSTGHQAAVILMIPAAMALAIAARGAPFPGFFIGVYAAVAGLAAAVIGLLIDTNKSNAGFALLLVAHCYLTAGIALRPDYAKNALDQGLAIAKGTAPVSSALGKAAKPPGEKAFQVSGVLVIGGARQALTSKGAFAAGAAIPDVGTVKSITDDEVVIVDPAGAEERYPVPH